MLVSLSSRKTTVERLLKSKEYRDAYVLEHIKNGVAFQIRTLREDRDWTQGDLGDAMGKPRNVISRIEDPNYGKTTLTTLREVAAAFDVGLLVKFVPFSAQHHVHRRIRRFVRVGERGAYRRFLS